MKLLLGAKKYLEKTELTKKRDIEMHEEGDVPEEHNDLAVPNQNTLSMKLFATVVQHPLEYAKTLVMMGYEPLPCYQAPWFGKTYYTYPNMFKYVAHIYSVDGLLGCFRGIVSKSTSVVIQKSFMNYFDENYPAPTMSASLLDKLKRNIAVKCICTLASHPLQLMSVRCMAQFVGRESRFSEWNLLSNVLTILKLEGLAGLFKGFWARLFGEVCMVASSVIIIHSIYSWNKSRALHEDESFDRSMVIYSAVVNYGCTTYFYPWNVVSTTMMVNQSGLNIGQPPMSPIFQSSYTCYTYLGYMNQLKRGSGYCFRWVPTISRADEVLIMKPVQ